MLLWFLFKSYDKDYIMKILTSGPAIGMKYLSNFSPSSFIIFVFLLLISLNYITPVQKFIKTIAICFKSCLFYIILPIKSPKPWFYKEPYDDFLTFLEPYAIGLNWSSNIYYILLKTIKRKSITSALPPSLYPDIINNK